MATETISIDSQSIDRRWSFPFNGALGRFAFSDEDQLDEKRRQLEMWEQIERQEQQRLERQRLLLERRSDVLVKRRGQVDELHTLLEQDGAATDEDRRLRHLQQQLDECRSKTEQCQQQWTRAEQLLLDLAVERDHQALEEAKGRDGDPNLT